ncbi:hypothetical protein AKJ09_04049 [Labilithrix luteola]|uniref:Uncharacterized protein n=1 Tax=Labilithrix luteola TaxID=1391654 RepID=A0A0K1PV26_9BACT|nr:hypothetical protein AKJ09_04049 [Labilithrix luteola]
MGREAHLDRRGRRPCRRHGRAPTFRRNRRRTLGFQSHVLILNRFVSVTALVRDPPRYVKRWYSVAFFSRSRLPCPEPSSSPRLTTRKTTCRVSSTRCVPRSRKRIS